MKALSYTATRKNLAKTMEQVCQDHSPIIITRKTNNSVFMMSLEDYTALQETAYLLRSLQNTRRLIESISQLENRIPTSQPLAVPGAKRHPHPAVLGALASLRE